VQRREEEEPEICEGAELDQLFAVCNLEERTWWEFLAVTLGAVVIFAMTLWLRFRLPAESMCLSRSQ
jgi:hypothetical protein